MNHITDSLSESALRGRRFFLLFLLLLTTLILYPYAEATVFGYYAFRVIGSSAILISAYAANVRRSLLIFVGVLAVPALIQHMLLSRSHASSFGIVNMVLSFIFDVVVVATIFRHVFAREQVNSETVFGWLGSISTRMPTFTPFPTGSTSFITALAPPSELRELLRFRLMRGRFPSWRLFSGCCILLFWWPG